MLDFLIVSTKSSKQRGTIEVYPKFIIKKSSDLMIRGGDFYAIWDEEKNLWSTDEQDVIRLVDRELDAFAKENSDRFADKIRVLHMWDAESGSIDIWHKYCQKQMRDSFHMLDEKLIFSNTEIKKEDYASKQLGYPLKDGERSAYDTLMSTLYSDEERKKIEWSIGSVVKGDSKKIQKFLVLYGAAGTGKSTVLNIIQQLFEGYYTVFDARSLGSSSNSFALEAFKSNPLVAIQHDGDLSKIEDNTRLNSLVSHELMTVNEKFRSAYSNQFKCFLFMGTNKPVKITDAKSGLIRRLIDVSPTGKKVSSSDYKKIMQQIKFELGAIAWHCMEVYESDTGAFDTYIPTAMLGASNDFYNFVQDSYDVFKENDGVTLKAAWEMYKTYCDDAKVQYPFSQRIFKEELKNYFVDFEERYLKGDVRVRNYYKGFKFKFTGIEIVNPPEKMSFMNLEEIPSLFDKVFADCPAQYATAEGIPSKRWADVKTKLSDLDTKKEHYVQIPIQYMTVDFDFQDKEGNKLVKKNIEEASKWPPTYAEISKSGGGVHLTYIYDGDASKVSRIYSENIEIKLSTGNSALRRKLTKCNNVPIATINSGLPLKGEKMVNTESIKSEKGLRNLIKRNLNKEIHPGTKPSIDFIYQILEDAYTQGLNYDVTDMRNAILAFASASTNHAEYCIRLTNKMKFKSLDPSPPMESEEDKKVFFDVEVAPNLFVVCWKIEGEGKNVVKMINPSSEQIEELTRLRLIGFNNRVYDNHIMYARMMGYDNQQLYKLSYRIINAKSREDKKNVLFGEAYNLSYTDIYDFAASGHKQSLKKFEIEMGIHHQELGLPWDQPVPEELWDKVADYCANDVIATEATFNYLKSDWTAREILADIAGMTVNDTTNSLTTKIIFGSNRTPQDQFNYRDMGDTNQELFHPNVNFDFDPEYTLFTKDGKPVFPGYKFNYGASTYRGEEVGEGGYVYAEPGMYGDVALLDIASMHPHSLIAEWLFGEYTQKFQDLVNARIAIKHKDFEAAKKMFDGKLAKYLTDEDSAKALSTALKTAINSVYGLTSAKFPNPFCDDRNVDNIVAKRGALFMVNLKHEVQRRGFTVAHIKTDSIKIPDATQEIIQFVMDYGELYGYTFEHEATYDRMCLVNDAVYIAKYKDGKEAEKWTATGTQFAVPFVFKTLFSHEPIEFSDLCETKSTATSLYLDMNENLPDVSDLEKQCTKLMKENESEREVILDLIAKINKGHDYHFVGKVGQFTPMRPGSGGGLLMREKDGKYYAVTGTKGYRWMESEMVRTLEKEDDVDLDYYNKLTNEAIKSIIAYGDYEWFVSNRPYTPPPFSGGVLIGMNAPVYKEEAPFN